MRRHILNDCTGKNENFRENGALRARENDIDAMRMREMKPWRISGRRKSGNSPDLRGKLMFLSSQIFWGR